jgi:hypothetical protein
MKKPDARTRYELLKALSRVQIAKKEYDANPPNPDDTSQWFQYSEPFNKLADIIAEILETDVDESDVLLAGNAFTGRTMAWDVFRRFQAGGLRLAIDGLTQAYQRQTADVIFYLAIRGLVPRESLEIAPDIAIMRVEDCKGSKMAARLLERDKAPWWAREREQSISAFAITRVRDWPMKTKSQDRTPSPPIDKLRDAVEGFTMIGPSAPAPDVWWMETTDADFSELLPQNYGGSHVIEIPHHGSNYANQEGADLVAKYLAIGGSLGKKLRIAMNRLNLAQRRSSAGNKAIEAAISLEALLSDGARDDLTFRYSIRSAFLLSNNPDERDKIRHTVRALYALRSKVVHGGEAGDKPIAGKLPRTIATEGIDICARLIRACVDLGGEPDWDHLEMGGSVRKK